MVLSNLYFNPGFETVLKIHGEQGACENNLSNDYPERYPDVSFAHINLEAEVHSDHG